MAGVIMTGPAAATRGGLPSWLADGERVFFVQESQGRRRGVGLALSDLLPYCPLSPRC